MSTSPNTTRVLGVVQFPSLPVGGNSSGRLAFSEDAKMWGQFICDKRESQWHIARCRQHREGVLHTVSLSNTIIFQNPRCLSPPCWCFRLPDTWWWPSRADILRS